jgi:hypothetical protein
MSKLILAVAILWGIVLVSEPALANCTFTTVYMPDGRVLTCQTCCYGGNCTQNCF